MKVLLLQPPVGYAMPQYFQAESLGLGYIGAVLRRDGHEVEILDAQIQGLRPREAIKEILARDFDCLGMTASHEQKKMLLWTASAVRRAKKSAILIAGGYLPTLSAEHLLAACPELDFAIRGEGEVAVSEVFRRIARDEDWREAPGVAYVKDGMPVLNPPPPLIQDLDSIPFPARDALSQAIGPVKARITTSRGCYHRCSFCCVHTFYSISGGRGQRYRKPENVVEEIESVIASTGIRDFRFSDDDFLGPSAKTKERVVRLAEEIKARKLGITFGMECRADEVERDILKLLKEAGLRDVFLGIESGVQEQLNRYQKGTTVEQNRRAIEIVRELGLDLRSGFIILDPYTTLAELVENMQFLNETGIAQETTRVARVPFLARISLFGGVPLVEQLRADRLLIDKGIDVDYVFRDRRIRAIYHLLRLLGTYPWFISQIRTRLKHRARKRRLLLERQIQSPP